MTETLQVPIWLIMLGLCFTGTLIVGLLFWMGAIAVEQDERDNELDAREKLLERVEGEQAAREIRRSWDVALPGMEDQP